jgi:hypothetical protein
VWLKLVFGKRVAHFVELYLFFAQPICIR